MTAFEKMRLREKSFGDSLKDAKINSSKYLVDSTLSSDPSFTEAEIIRNGNVIGTINLRMNNRRIYNNAPRMDIQAYIDAPIRFTFSDVFHTTIKENDTVKEDYWLCIEESNQHGIFRRGICEACNYLLPFQNKYTYEIHERWCSVRSPYSSGLDVGNTISVGNTKYDIRMPYDEETKLFYQDYRFLIGYADNKPIAYKTIRTDDVTNKYVSRQEGFLEIKVEQSTLQEDDNWELMIASYKEPPLPEPPSIGSCKIVFSGQPTLKVGGSQKVFSVIFLDSDGEIITTLEPIWTLDIPPELEALNQIIKVSEIGNEITIKALTGDNAIGMSFILKVSADDPNFGYFEAEQSVEIIELF